MEYKLLVFSSLTQPPRWSAAWTSDPARPMLRPVLVLGRSPATSTQEQGATRELTARYRYHQPWPSRCHGMGPEPPTSQCLSVLGFQEHVLCVPSCHF
jgi:hypothetical protein